MGQFFSYVIGVCVAGLIVFGIYFGLQTASPAYARQALADEASGKTFDELERDLDSLKSSTVIAAITAIGQGDDQIERRVSLIAKAAYSRDQTVQAISTLAIRRMGDAVKPTVRKLLKSDDPTVVRSVCGVVRSLGVDGDEFAPDLFKLLESPDSNDRHAAIFGLKDMSPEVLVPALDNVIQELDAKNFNTQCQACFVLKQMGSGATPAVERLVRLLQEGNPSTKSRAAEALASIGPVDGYDIPELVGKQLEAPVYIEKVRGLASLALLGPDANTPANITRIQNLIDDPMRKCLPEALLAMYRLTGEKESALRVYQDMIEKRSTRLAAMECLGAMGVDATVAVPRIMDFLNDQELVVSETAILALKQIGPTADAALPRLKKLLKHDDFLISVAAQEAIDAIAPKAENE